MEHVPISDGGFRFGRGVFETVAVRGGLAEFYSWHAESLQVGALALGLPPPRIPDREPPGGQGIWRWFHTETGTRTWWQEGCGWVPESLVLGLAEVPIHSQAWSARFKTLAYLTQIQNKPPEEDREVVVMNERGEMVSAAMANLFWVRAGTVFTAPPEAGCRCGVVRRWVMERGGVKVEEVRQGIEALRGVDEVFLTNSRIGIVPCRAWPGGRRAEVPGPVVLELRQRFQVCEFS